MNPKISRRQVEQEARAKILWGEDPKSVLIELRVKGVDPDEASDLVDSLVEERRAQIRGIGVKKIVFGIVLVIVPGVCWFIFQRSGVYYPGILAVAAIGGMWGCWLIIDGIHKLSSPGSAKGDLTDEAE